MFKVEKDYGLLDQLGAIWEQKEVSFAGLIKMTANAIKEFENTNGTVKDEDIPTVLESLINYKPYKIYKKELVEKYFKEKETGFIDEVSYEEYERSFILAGYEVIDD